MSLTQSYENKKSFSVESWAELGITNVKYDVADHVGAATPQQVAEIIEFIEEQGKLGKQVRQVFMFLFNEYLIFADLQFAINHNSSFPAMSSSTPLFHPL